MLGVTFHKLLTILLAIILLILPDSQVCGPPCSDMLFQFSLHILGFRSKFVMASPVLFVPTDIGMLFFSLCMRTAKCL